VTAGDALVLAALEGLGPLTPAEVAAETGFAPTSIQKMLRRLHAANLARVVTWQRAVRRGSPTALWGAGPGPSTPRPKPTTPAERNAKYRQRNARLISARRYGERSPYANIWGGLMPLETRSK
jgi:hypothetical protein